MTAAVRATVLVIAALAGATVAAALGIATRPAAGQEAQEFWRAEQSRPFRVERHAGRARLMQRRHRHVRIRTAVRSRNSEAAAVSTAGEGRKADAPAVHRFDRILPRGGAAVIRTAVMTPPELEPDTFDRRATVLPFEPLRWPPLAPREPQPKPEPKPEQQRKPSMTRGLCIAAVLAIAAIAGLLSSLTNQSRGIAHA